MWKLPMPCALMYSHILMNTGFELIRQIKQLFFSPEKTTSTIHKNNFKNFICHRTF